ncbi:MAG: hypothetical protein LBD86_06340 [Spirochaetaceae bacterium]|jgi:hypothetical protein|nr:hypothetical protein [Spirochaetaceae bacterium]
MAQMTAEWGKSLSFEKVWAMFAETDRKIAESRAEADRRMAAADRRMAAAERSMAETKRAVKEAARVVAELSKNVGGLNRSLGGLIETLIAARLWEKFPEYGFVCSFQRVLIFDEAKRIRTDADILLSNTDKAMAVEVKHEFDKEKYVDEHLRRMEVIRAYPPMVVEGKQLLGAVAGGLVAPNIARYAYDAGFYVLELTGESVGLIPPPDGFKPGMW